MIRSIPRAIAAALFGALIGPACLVGVYAAHRDAGLGIGRLPAAASGFYGLERNPTGYLVWMSRRGDVTLAGLDRRSAWTCAVRFRGARPGNLPQPDVSLAVDGVTVATRTATNDFQDLAVVVPRRPLKSGLTLTITSSTTFVPGPADPRTLGIQVEDLNCRPEIGSVVMPPRRAMLASAIAAAALGAALGLTGITAGSAMLGVLLVAVAQAAPLSSGTAPYGDYPGTAIRLAAWMALLLVAACRLLEAANRGALRNTARFVVVFSAGAIYLKLLGLLHPSKAVVDALFHAHRLGDVLAGHYYFTQLSTSATPFPYAIGLYLFAAPWAFFTDNHVALLRIVACASEGVAGALLYLVVVRARGDRIMGTMAVALFSMVPLSYVIVGNANLTHAFGQTVALAAVAAAAISPPQLRRAWRFALLVLVATLGFISHISVLMLLAATLAALGIGYRLLGGPALRAPARLVWLATAAALVLAVVLYWGHFPEVYKAQLARVRAVATADTRAPAVARASLPAGTPPAAPALGKTTIPLSSRAVDAVRQTITYIGWPILVLALVGMWRLSVSGWRDPMGAAVAAWTAVGVLFVGLSVITAVDVRYQQDAWEFIGRVEHVTCPAAVVLAAAGAAWAWRANLVTRLASSALLLAAVWIGVRSWAGWF